MGWNPPPEDKKMRAHIKVHPQGLHTPLREIIDERLDEQRSKEGPKAVNRIAVERWKQDGSVLTCQERQSGQKCTAFSQFWFEPSAKTLAVRKNERIEPIKRRKVTLDIYWCGPVQFTIYTGLNRPLYSEVFIQYSFFFLSALEKMLYFGRILIWKHGFSMNMLTGNPLENTITKRVIIGVWKHASEPSRCRFENLILPVWHTIWHTCAKKWGFVCQMVFVINWYLLLYLFPKSSDGKFMIYCIGK